MKIGSRAKRILNLLPPRVGLPLLIALRWMVRPSVRDRQRHSMRIVRRLGSPTRVVSGPFSGMTYLGPSCASQGGYLPKLLGTYERECWPAIERLLSLKPDCVINVGAAEGYYAVGLLRRLPMLRVVAFEMERPYHAALRSLARKNNVEERLCVAGACTPIALELALRAARNPVVVMDCEGDEAELLDPDLAPRLKDATVLVELHERLRPGVTTSLTDRFSSTHHLQLFRSGAVDSHGPDLKDYLTRDDLLFAFDEGRGGDMEWLLMEPA